MQQVVDPDPTPAPAGPGPRHDAVPALAAVTEEVADPGDLVALLPAGQPLFSWVRRGDGLVGWGEVARFTTTGPDRFAAARRWWASTVAAARIRDDVAAPGSGLIAGCSFAFADDSAATSIVVVPAIVVARRDGRCWVTRVRDTTAASVTGRRRHGVGPVPGAGGVASVRGVGLGGVQPGPAPADPGAVLWSDGELAGPAWTARVASAVARIDAGELAKVVLARDSVGVARAPVDVRWPLRRLAAHYLPCWTFTVDSMFGATPELLLRSDRGLVTSRVLAGTIGRTGDAADPDADTGTLARTLARSGKDLAEHRLAVASAAHVLRRHCSSVNVPDEPFVLQLPNVLHLATDVTGALASPTGLFDLVADLHPTAAVGGTPTETAVRLIAELEGTDRRRYAGPVGWVDANGDGELGIALRCAELDSTDPRRVRAWAGCGIVTGSDPDAELAESEAKLVPVRESLGG